MKISSGEIIGHFARSDCQGRPTRAWRSRVQPSINTVDDTDVAVPWLLSNARELNKHDRFYQAEPYCVKILTTSLATKTILGNGYMAMPVP